MNTCSISLVLTLISIAASCLSMAAPAVEAANPAPTPLHFRPDDSGGFTFNTGVLRGTLRNHGQSLGLTGVTHVPSDKRLDRSNGLLSHYRVFTKGVRYGGGAWDWPSQARVLIDGAVEVRWEPALDRPFAMRAIYRWSAANALDLVTEVEPLKPLVGFESFVANYFDESFTNAAVCVQGKTQPGQAPAFVPVEMQFGAWQMFPRAESFRSLIEDGRWKLTPNPVDWRIQPPFALPLAYRRAPTSQLTAIVMSSGTDCFAIASPEQNEGHRSLYFSLFGRDLNPGQVFRARTRLTVTTQCSDAGIIQMFNEYAR